MKRAFLVIVEFPDRHTGPVIGDVHWAVKDAVERWGIPWDVHTTEATAEMLAHHGVPYTPENVECPKCRGRYWTCPLRHYPHRDGCPHCPDCTPENVEEPT